MLRYFLYNKSIGFSFFLSVLIYLPTTVILPASSYYLLGLLLVPLILYRIDFKFKLIFVGLFLSLFFSLVSFFMLEKDLNYLGNFLPLQIGLCSSLVIASYLRNNKLFFIILSYFFIFEVLVGVLQYYLGIQSFFAASSEMPSYGQDLLYFKRVFGLSNNSSDFTGKALCFLVICNSFIWDRKKLRIAIYISVFTVMFITFSRSGIVSVFSYFLVVTFFSIFNLKRLPYLIILGTGAILCFFYSFDFDFVYNQFTRGKGNVEISGRDLIWFEYYKSISDNLFFGNHGIKSYLTIPDYGLMHAHNSYIMSIYNFGIISFLCFLFPLVMLLLSNFIKLKNLIPILVFSLAQYYLFWGGSFVDIVFFTVILSSLNYSGNKCDDKFHIR